MVGKIVPERLVGLKTYRGDQKIWDAFISKTAQTRVEITRERTYVRRGTLYVSL